MSNKSLATLQAELKAAEDAVTLAKRRVAAFKALTPDQQLAESLHGLLCRANHTDGCTWEYGSWSSMSFDHGTWLSQAVAARSAATATYDDDADINEAIVAIVRAATGRR